MQGIHQLLSILVLMTTPYETAAIRDRDVQRELGRECRYITFTSQAEYDELLPTVKFALAFVSREHYIPNLSPEKLPTVPVLRVHLESFGWTRQVWADCFGYKRNPYTTYDYPTTVPARFFVVHVTDQSRNDGTNDSYLRLLFGHEPPTTVEQFWKLVGVNPKRKKSLAFGIIPGLSGVNVTEVSPRLIRYDDGEDAVAWTTFDQTVPYDETDPLSELTTTIQAEGSEIFALVPKTALNVRGVFPITVLADGEGRLVPKAPVTLVRDHTELGGSPEIRNPGSCIACHSEGPRYPNSNALEELITSGVHVFGDDYEKTQQAEQFYFSDPDIELQYWEERYTIALRTVNGLTPEVNAAAYTAAFNNYSHHLGLEECAAELFVTPEELTTALGWAGVTDYRISPRLAGLPHGQVIPRVVWEREYLNAVSLLRKWKEGDAK